MKPTLGLIAITLLSSAWSWAATAPLHVLQFNVRSSALGDTGLNDWEERRARVISQIRFHDADIVGVQEPHKAQVEEMRAGLPGFHFIGVGRNDGKETGEYTGIFYREARVELLASDVFWLSEDPAAAGVKGWDAAQPRLVVWGKFRDRLTDQIFYHFNTHFDHKGEQARRQSALLVLRKIHEIAGTFPAFLTGDFNSRPDGIPVQTLLDPSNPQHLQNAKNLSISGHYGPAGTMNAFGVREVHDEPIDYIFVTPGWTVLKHATLTQVWQGHYASDHFAVLAWLSL